MPSRVREVTIHRDGRRWVWYWHTPWHTTVVSPHAYGSAEAAAKAGHRFARENRFNKTSLPVADGR